MEINEMWQDFYYNIVKDSHSLSHNYAINS